ncbi:HAD hydrolase family protein [candidate division GN15 bacterium]|nr:HAD hydrolase family protein [candidate division GN15 bacterium]
MSTSAPQKLSREEFMSRLKDVKLLALDVDGVLTDDSIYFGPDGFEMKRFNISDGFLIVLAMRAGLEIAIVSGRYSPATDTRMRDLGVKHIMQGQRNKVKMLEPLLDELGLTFAQVAFMGNDLLDITLARTVGLPIAVADAVDDLKAEVLWITDKKGGQGAVREILDLYFKANGKEAKEYIVG